MCDSTGLEFTHRGKQCAYCGRLFARSEHLSRHERSRRSNNNAVVKILTILIIYLPDRNERPFRCTLCNATFTRQDVFKKHHSRYHMGIVPQQHTQEVSNVNPPVSMQSRLMRESSAEASSMTVQNEIEPSTATGWPVFDPASLLQMDSPTMDSLLSELDFPTVPESHMSSNPTGRTQESSHDDHGSTCHASLSENTAPTSSPRQVIELPTWKGSFAISERKWCELDSAIHIPISVSPRCLYRIFQFSVPDYPYRQKISVISNFQVASHWRDY